MTKGVPKASSAEAERRMRSTGQRDTAPEMAIRRELHRRGYRYRVDAAPIAGIRRKADIVFSRRRVAVYVHGCFWHGCPQHGTWPKANADFWRSKIETNRRRDADTERMLREAGWTPVVLWEHDPLGSAIERIEQELQSGERPQ